MIVTTIIEPDTEHRRCEHEDGRRCSFVDRGFCWMFQSTLPVYEDGKHGICRLCDDHIRGEKI